MTLTTSPEAAAAAKKILSFYPEIPAADPKNFATGLVQTLSIYPPSVVTRACDAVRGIPGCVKFLNLAEIRKHLEEWAEEEYADIRRRKIAERKRLSEPIEDPQVKHRVTEGFKNLQVQLKRGIGPSSV